MATRNEVQKSNQGGATHRAVRLAPALYTGRALQLLARDGVERQLHAAGDSQFVIHISEIISDGVLSKLQFRLISLVLMPSASN